MILSAPGKTFLLGEYLALGGGPSLLVATEPRFELRVETARSSGERYPFAPGSPAGLFFERFRSQFSGKHFSFFDPHQGLGGLGASSAQFALLYAYVHPVVIENPDWGELLNVYRAMAWNGEGLPPSGADLVAQIHGGLTYWDGHLLQARSVDWAFPQLAFTLLRTGAKLATHEHLRSEKSATFVDLKMAVKKGLGALDSRDEKLFCMATQQVAAELERSGRVAVKTREILEELGRLPEVRAAKGCGAMGADIVLVLHNRDDRGKIIEYAGRRGLKPAGGSEHIASGLGFVSEIELGRS